MRAELIRRHVRELRRLGEEIDEIRKLITLKVQESGSDLMELRGVGPIIAAKILGEVGDIGRIRSKAAFAMLNGSPACILGHDQSSQTEQRRQPPAQLSPSYGGRVLSEDRSEDQGLHEKKDRGGQD